jgi:hypothetical protein
MNTKPELRFGSGTLKAKWIGLRRARVGFRHAERRLLSYVQIAPGYALRDLHV